MTITLQRILIVGSTLFFIYIFNMVRTKKLELKYTLTWMITSIAFIILSSIPNALNFISKVLSIKSPMNALFFILIFFIILIIFSLTVALSRNSKRVRVLNQEIAILKLELEKLRA